MKWTVFSSSVLWVDVCRAILARVQAPDGVWCRARRRAVVTGLCLGIGVAGLVCAPVAAQDAAAAAASAASATSVPGAAADPAAPDTPPPALEFFREPDLRAAALSPSGRQLAAIVALPGYRNALVVLDMVGGTPPKLAARFSDIDIDSFRWLNEDRLVFDIADHQRGGAAQRYSRGLFSVRPDGREQRTLVRLRYRAVVSEARLNEERLLDPNHQLLHTPPGGEEVVVGEWRWDAAGDFTEIIAKRLNVVSGRTSSLALGVPDGAVQWLFDPDGTPRVVVTQRQGRSGVHWRAAGQREWTRLADFAYRDEAWWPVAVDGDRLYVSLSQGEAGTRVLKRFDFSRGKPLEDALVSTPGFDFIGRLLSETLGSRVLGVRVITDAETTAWFDPRLKALQAEIDAKLPGRINRLDCRRCDHDDMRVLVTSFNDQNPGDLFVWHAADKRLEGVGAVRKGIVPARMAQRDFHRIRARDGLEMPVWVTTPPATKGALAQARPAVVLVHGGPWVRGGYWQWNAWAQFLASRGYVVIEPEFRGSTGYGSRHYRAGWRQWGRTMQDDVADAVKWAVAGGLVDGKRVCIAGASYGGYATLMGLVRHPDLYRCGVSWVGVTDLSLLLTWRSDSDMSEDARRYSLPQLVGDIKADADMLREASPVHHAAAIRAPLLLAFGREDRRVPLVHGERMRKALIDAGRPPQWVVYDGEGHGGWSTETQVDFAERMEQFLRQHLR